MPHVVIVVESCFGNTGRVAAALAEGLRDAGAAVEVVAADAAPASPVADLVLVGAPTHNAGMPTAASRTQAAQHGGTAASSGVREWIERAAVDAPVHTFSTKVAGMFSGSAGKAAAKRLVHRGARATRGEDFLVSGREGPLVPGEEARAAAWGRALVAGT
ncbi:flavodoxin family protein [Cellulomonas triticagri]|uniref:Flavodoxin/nitric oxide synthase n=1 Tax=Cellulomonas triticagri TaxID=2483352 RepID=A0A3M2JR61_9CELL|nr:flavodoxin domain-containing protein [Cellulomonas triticagri]RMI12708.1 flavodoxin/nitric oxide synthase [Cellulomonas triticagri]